MGYRADEWHDDWKNTTYGKDYIWRVQHEKEQLKHEEKLTIYKQIARDALMSWNGLSEEEATKKVQESSNEELEAQVYAEGSIDYALQGLQKYSSEVTNNHGLHDAEIKALKELIMTGQYQGHTFGAFRDSFLGKLGFADDINIDNSNNMVLSVLSTIHDGWVKDNQKKFMARDKKYQHMPIELIGWKEAKSDLLFLKPILSALSGTIALYTDRYLEEHYNKRVQAFLEEKGITNVSELTEQISRGAEFYPALEGQDDIVQALQDTEFVEQHVVSGIREKGIGKNEQFAQQLFSERTIEGADELEALRTQKKDLVEQERTISEAEKLIEAKENQVQSLDE